MLILFYTYIYKEKLEIKSLSPVYFNSKNLNELYLLNSICLELILTKENVIQKLSEINFRLQVKFINLGFG